MKFCAILLVLTLALASSSAHAEIHIAEPQEANPEANPWYDDRPWMISSPSIRSASAARSRAEYAARASTADAAPVSATDTPRARAAVSMPSTAAVPPSNDFSLKGSEKKLLIFTRKTRPWWGWLLLVLIILALLVSLGACVWLCIKKRKTKQELMGGPNYAAESFSGDVSPENSFHADVKAPPIALA